MDVDRTWWTWGTKNDVFLCVLLGTSVDTEYLSRGSSGYLRAKPN